MPVKACNSNGKPGYRWGERGRCYTYPAGNDKARREAKRRAIIQGIAAGEKPTAALFTAELDTGIDRLADGHLAALTREWERALLRAGATARERFALTSAADWQPPPEGTIITPAQLAALAASLNEALRPIWTRIILETANAPLARIEISWDVKHPVTQRLVEQAALRTGARLGEASQFILRDTIAQAYEQGLSVREASALIQANVRGAAPWQADMLARTDLVSLANGASRAAAQTAGVQFKTWIATLDDKTRPEHMEAHGQTVPIGDVFQVGDEQAEYPGDPNLSDANAANCRCTLGYADTLDEADALLSSAEGSKMSGMTTRQKRLKRRAARKQSEKKLPTATEVLGILSAKQSDNMPTSALTASARPIAFHGSAVIEGRISDDNSIAPRVVLPDALSWPEMPVPFMAQTKTAEGHDGAEVAGRIDSFNRKRGVGRVRDIQFAGELTTPFGINEIAPMIDDKTLRYVSADLGASEWALVKRSTFEEVPDSESDIAAALEGEYAMGLKSAKIKAATLVPTQAIQGAMVALTASADDPSEATLTFPIEFLTGEAAELNIADKTIEFDIGLTAAAAPRKPPREWFETPEPPGKMPLTVTTDGRVYGHLATWDSCHMSFLPNCVPPPRSSSNYAYAHVCELDTADGTPITVGKLMFSPTDGGHADRRLTAQKASAYYDRTGMAAAYLRFSDGAHGIWAAGSLNPSLTDEQREEMRRELRLHPPSGDWRPINGEYELICGLAVAVPGFATPRATVTVVASAEGIELEDAIIASSGHFDPDPEAVAALEQEGLVDEELAAEREMRELAARAQSA